MRGFNLKITLRDSDPKITRTVSVPENASFGDLHSIIQSVMGWGDYHLYCFRVSNTDMGPTTVAGCVDEHSVPVSDHYGKRIGYNYDFGDDWWRSTTPA